MANEIEQNIIDKIKAEETLGHKEELLRLALEGSGDGVWDWNVEANKVVFSDRWKTMLGYEKDELEDSFSTFEMLLHPDDKPRVMVVIEAYFKNEIEQYVIEFRLRCKDDSYKWILARAALANRNEKGEPLRMVGTHTDISKSKELETRLRTLTVAIEQSPTSIVITDLEANLIYVNPQFTRVTGYELDEIIGTNPRVLQSGLTTKETYLDLWNTVTQGQVWRGELTNRRKNGEVYYEEAHIAPVFNENNEIIQYVGVKFDVTARKKNEEAIFNLNHDLQYEKQFSDSILNGLPTIFYMIDMTGKLIRWNPNFEKVTGYSDEEMACFDSVLTFIAEQDRQRVKTAIERVFSDGSSSVEAEFLTKDGTVIPYYFIGERILLDECFYLIGIGEDITEHKKTEKILIDAKETAEAATKEKSAFLANMSHEFRTPMNAIMGFSQLVLNKDISPEIRDYLEKIKTASDGLLAVLNDILDFSKIEAGRIILEAHHFSLINLINNLDNLFALQALDKALEFKIELSSDVPIQLIGDSVHLQQVLSNLLSNAIKFTKQGRVFLNVELVKIELLNATLKFTISDTGIGISKEDLGKLFVPFSQADSSITRRFGGTGLGLVISRDLLQLMNSELHILSEPNKGTTVSFEVTLIIDSEFSTIENVNINNTKSSFELENKISVSKNPEMLKQKLTELNDLLAEDNFISAKLLEEIRAYLSDDKIIEFNKIQKFIANIEYEKARHLLKPLLNVSDKND
jgi:PAS domain S-box-containing protein